MHRHNFTYGCTHVCTHPSPKHTYLPTSPYLQYYTHFCRIFTNSCRKIFPNPASPTKTYHVSPWPDFLNPGYLNCVSQICERKISRIHDGKNIFPKSFSFPNPASPTYRQIHYQSSKCWNLLQFKIPIPLHSVNIKTLNYIFIYHNLN